MWEGEVLKRHRFDIVSITLGNGSQIGVWHFRCLLFALVLFCHPNPRGDTMLPSLLINWPDHRPCCFLFCVLFCVVLFVWVLFLLLLCGFLFVLCWLDVLARWKLNGLCIDPYSVPLLVTSSIRWCCHCTISLNLQICNWLSGSNRVLFCKRLE